MNRRSFLKVIGITTAALSLPTLSFAQTKKVAEIKSVSKNDVDKLLRCRTLIDTYRKGKPYTTSEKRDQATIIMNQGLSVEGYRGAAEFAVDNDTFNKIEYKDCVPIDGKCDGCPHLEVAPCAVYGAFACKGTQPKIAADAIYMIALRGKNKGEHKTIAGKSILICPEGHGFYVDETKRKVPRFDYNWRV